MARKTVDTMALMRSICVLLMLVCILFFILPHAHDCIESDCPLCVLKNIFSEIVLAVCFFSILPVLEYFVEHFTYLIEQFVPLTLIYLKVKLSD